MSLSYWPLYHHIGPRPSLCLKISDWCILNYFMIVWSLWGRFKLLGAGGGVVVRQAWPCDFHDRISMVNFWILRLEVVCSLFFTGLLQVKPEKIKVFQSLLAGWISSDAIQYYYSKLIVFKKLSQNRPNYQCWYVYIEPTCPQNVELLE